MPVVQFHPTEDLIRNRAWLGHKKISPVKIYSKWFVSNLKGKEQKRISMKMARLTKLNVMTNRKVINRQYTLH